MIFLSIGSNLNSIFGDRFENIKKSIQLLKLANITPLESSNYFETPSYPNKKNPKFINIILSVAFNDSPESMIKKISIIEKKMGRLKTLKNEPRTCDIDIIDFNRLRLSTKKTVLPHPRAHNRNFVLMPLAQISPNWKHPISNKKIDILIKSLSLQSRNEITRLNESAILE